MNLSSEEKDIVHFLLSFSAWQLSVDYLAVNSQQLVQLHNVQTQVLRPPACRPLGLSLPSQPASRPGLSDVMTAREPPTRQEDHSSANDDDDDDDGADDDDDE